MEGQCGAKRSETRVVQAGQETLVELVKLVVLGKPAELQGEEDSWEQIKTTEEKEEEDRAIVLDETRGGGGARVLGRIREYIILDRTSGGIRARVLDEPES